MVSIKESDSFEYLKIRELLKEYTYCRSVESSLSVPAVDARRVCTRFFGVLATQVGSVLAILRGGVE